MNRDRALRQLEALKKYMIPQRLAAEGWDQEWKTLISTLLSARTLDETTIRVCEKLFNKYPSVFKLSKAKLEDVQKIINPVNYFRNKSKYVIKCCNELHEIFGDKVPMNIEDMTKLTGVGRKTANVVMSEYGFPGVGVDTHVQRISYKLGWVKEKNNAEKIEHELKKLFPKEKWNDINTTLVNVGRSNRGKKEDIILDEIKKIK
ncbi:endonuclease III [Candidatus Woesearchaeota archaeon]|nr:endonuclease III [Candidatus Woesearchaeota archaeon]